MMSESPGAPIVDAHVHLWDPARFPIPWLAGNAVLDRPYGAADFREHAAGLPVEAMVYVQVEVDPSFALIEARWAVDQARSDPRLQSVVPWAPVERGDRVRAYLDALLEIGAGLIHGVRRNIQDEPDPAFCLESDFLRGLRVLPDYDLSFDVCARHHQLPSVIEMVRACPETRFILDHLGKPPIQSGALDPWRGHLADLAAFPNVSCKLSGLVTEADHASWSPGDLAPYVRHAVEVFGEDRVAFGGDWPVVLEASSYRRWVETLAGLTEHLSSAARRKLWAENARHFYRLPTRAPAEPVAPLGAAV